MRSPNSEMIKADLKKGSWSHEEDEMLKSYIKRYGIWNWSHMPKFAGLKRSGKSCRLRWMNYLKPNVKRGNFSLEEEETILHFHSLLGNRWSAIASKLTGRSDNEVKNYWHTHLKKRQIKKLATKITENDDMIVSSLICEGNEVDKLQDNQETERSGSLLLHTSEDDSSSSSSCSFTSKDYEVEFNDDYYDLCSPGTVKDVQSFWNQICPLENLELGTSHQDISFDQVFSYSFDDATSLYNIYDHDYDNINH